MPIIPTTGKLTRRTFLCSGASLGYRDPASYKQTKNNDKKSTRRLQRLRAGPKHGCVLQLCQTFPPKAAATAVE